MTTSTTRRALAVVVALVVVASPIASVAGASPAASSPDATAQATDATASALQADDVLYRTNAGGSFTADGNTWEPLVDYMVAGEDETSSHGQPSAVDDSVPTGTPTQIWETERWDPADGEEMQYEFDVPDGQQVEVRLYFYDGYSGTANPGDRVFDVTVEDQTVDSFDPIEAYGDDTGGMESFTVTSDGTVDVDFGHVTENPQVNAIEIVSTAAEPDTLGAPSDVDFGNVVVGDSATETVTLTNLGNASDSTHPDITIDGVSVSGDGAFSAGAASQTTLAPGESAEVPVTFAPGSAESMSGTLEVSHSGSNSPVTVDLAGEGVSDVPVGFSKSTLQGFSAGNPTAIDFGPDGRAYVSTQGGTVYALAVERTGDDDYQVVDETQIDAIKDIPNHDDLGNLDAGEDNRQITGLTVGGTADEPVVYVSSSDPEIDVGQDDDDTDTNSGAISQLTLDWNDDGSLASVDHDVMVLGLPRSEENHATNGLDLTADGETLYVAQGGHTNKGAPGDNFGHTPEYALSAAILEVDLAQIESNHQATSLQTHDGNYPDLDYLYALPTIQGGALPFGGNDGVNQAKIVEGGPVQVYSPGYRNPYDLVVTDDGQVYAADHGPNGGWGGQPADANGDTTADAAAVTNHPNEDGSFGTNDQLVKVDEGEYGGHPAPIRANPTNADIYDENGNVVFDIDESNSPVPSSQVNPVEADYIPPTSGSPDPGAPAGSANTMVDENGAPVLFGPTGGIEEYTASNFGGAMEGDLLQAELYGSIKRVELSADGATATNVETIFNTDGPLGIAAQGDSEAFAGTVWTANHGGNDVTVFEPNDYGDGGDGEQCTGADDPSLDEDGDGYDNADEIDAGSDPCSAASTPPDFDDDGTSNVNDPDDDNDGIDDTEDLFAVDPDNGLETNLPATYSFAPNSESGTILDLGFTGVMMNGSNYQDLYDSSEVTAGGAANVLTVENVGQGDAHQNTNTQAHAYQVGVNADEPFTVETTVNGLPSDAEPFQSQGVFVGTGDQDNYVKLTASAFSAGDGSGVQLATEADGSFTDVANPAAPTAGNATTLSMTVYPSNGTVEASYAVADGEEQSAGETTVPTSWFDTTDGNGTAVGVIATSNGADSTFDATWQYLDVEPVTPSENQPPVADAGSDQTVEAGAEVTLDASNSTDPDGDDSALGYTWTQTAGPDAGLSQSDGETTTFTAPDADSETTLTFQVSVSDGQASDTDEVNVTVQPTDDPAPPADGEVVYRVNAGGSEVAATDGGPAWSADTGSTPSQYVNADGDNGLNTYSTGDTIALDDSVPSSTPASVFQTERYDVDTDGSTADDTEMQWSFPAESGETYEVRLYFAEIFLDSSNVDAQGPRTFDVVVEGETELDDYNLYQQYGHDVGVVESFEVTPSDDAIDVAFLHEQENPKISAIEVVAVDDGTGDDLSIAEAVATGGQNDSLIEDSEIQQAINWWSTGSEVPDTGNQTIDDEEIQSLINIWATNAEVGDGDGDQQPGSAMVEVTPDSGVEASTYGGGSFTVENTGDEQISSATFDLSSSAMPDVVFDPAGTAGDQAAKGLNIDSQSGDGVGVVSTADGDVFSQPHNGVNGSDGYDVLTVEFTDFDPGESVSFSADNDPTSIKGATVSSQEAGPISGLELARSTVSVEYEDGSVQETQLFGDGSAGGAQAALDDSIPQAPSIDVQDVALDDGALRDHHSAATVSAADQTVTVTGEPGETVTLLHFEAELELDNIPEYDGTPGYDIEAYEANKIEQVAYETVTLDSNGEAAVPVTLLDTTDVGGYNYLVAAHGEPGSGTGLDSNVVVLKYDESADDNAAPTIDAIANQTVTEGNSTTVPVGVDDPDGDTVSLSVNGPDFVTLSNGEVTVAPQSGDAGTYTVEVTADDGTDQTTESFQVTVEAAEPQVLHRVNAGEGTTVSATDDGPDWTGVADTSSPYLASVDAANNNYCGGADITADSTVPASTPDGVWDCERYGNSTWEFSVDSDQTVEVRLYFGNSFDGASEPGDRQFNVSVEGQQVLTQYDPVADVGHATGTMKNVTATDDGDGMLTVSFETGAVENPEVRAIEILESTDSEQ